MCKILAEYVKACRRKVRKMGGRRPDGRRVGQTEGRRPGWRPGRTSPYHNTSRMKTGVLTWKLHKINANNALNRMKIYKSCIKIRKNDLKSKKTSKTCQKFDFRMEPKITTLLPTCFKITAMHSVCCCSLPI